MTSGVSSERKQERMDQYATIALNVVRTGYRRGMLLLHTAHIHDQFDARAQSVCIDSLVVVS